MDKGLLFNHFLAIEVPEKAVDVFFALPLEL